MRTKQNIIIRKWETIVKSITLLVIGVLFLGRAINGIEPYATGDGPEYVLTTEAIYNHFTPDLRGEDSKSFKDAYIKAQEWTKNYKYETFDALEGFLANDNVNFLDQQGGIYVDKNKRKYGYHFFAYAAVNVPARWIADKVGANPLICFQVTNAFLIIITCFLLLFYTPFSFWKTILATLVFVFSSVYWHLGWTHPEVYTICLVTLAFWFYFQEKLLLGILLLSLASFQNQPLVIVLAFMALRALIVGGFKIKNLLKIGLCLIPFIIPPLFYLIHFNTTNLIKDAGFLSSEFITFTRVFGFYFDLNQGVILVIPFMLLTYVFLISRNWILVAIKREKFEYNNLLPLFLIVMACIVSMMVNWNHGQAIVNRYATWFSAIIIIHTLFLSEKFSSVPSLILFNYYFLTQTFSILYHEQFNINDWSQTEHRPIAKWVLDNHPNLYNPDPQIFIVRTTLEYNTSPSASPVFYIRDFQTVTKMIVHKDKLAGLLNYGFPQSEIDALKPKLKFINGWAYVNKKDIKSNMTGNDIYKQIRNIKLQIIEQRIRESGAWMKQIEQKAKDWGKTIDEAVRQDAEYIMQQEEKNR